MNAHTGSSAAKMPGEHRRVIVASSVGALFEWYDFYLYGALAPVLAHHFAAAADARAALVFALAGFAAGFVVRPLGALLFGRLGDLLGRKYTFLVTLLLMGGATFAIGLLPGHAAIGIAAPIALFVLRLLQGLAIGGEYGGVATYVAEHAPDGRRGAYTGWVQATATVGLLLALLVIMGTRRVLGDAAFEDWGWRVPFLLSIALVVVSVWIRLRLHESPRFRQIRQSGRWSRAPLTEAFGQWRNVRMALIALFGLVAGQAVVWYTGHFQALYFLTLHLKVDDHAASLLAAIALTLAAPLFVLFGAWSDRVGRKPIILSGCLLAALAFFPLFDALTEAANPALARARERVTVTVIAPAADCSWQSRLFGSAGAMSACDAARQWLTDRAVRFTTVAGDGAARVRIDGRTFELSAESATQRRLNDALDSAGYPQRADPRQIDRVRVVGILWLLLALVAMVYGPIAAILVELFPTRVRCSSVGLPYHVGNGFFGGLVPAATFAIGAQTGDLLTGLWFPVAVALLTCVVGLLFVPETRHRDIYAGD